MKSIEPQLKAAVIDAFVTGQSCTQEALANALARAGHPAGGTTIGQRFQRWAAAGIAATQVASNGHHTAYTFNWTGRPLDAATLRDAAEPALTDASGVERRDPQANKLRTALRIALGVREHGTQHLLLAACAQVGAREFHTLPKRAYEGGLKTSSKHVAGNYAAAVRGMLREAALADRIPVVLPKIWTGDIWDETRDRYWPPIGTLTQTEKALRCYWNHFARAIRGLKDGPKLPGQVTLEHVKAVCDAYVQLGHFEWKNHIKWTLRRVARDFREGPYAQTVGVGERRSRNGALNEDRLLGPDGDSASDGDWSRFLRMLPHNGYGPVWMEFLGWYGEFISLPTMEIEMQEDRFPSRPARWGLKKTSRVKRIIELRTILHHAPAVLGKPTAELDPFQVFGLGARKIIAALRARWANRAKAGQVSSANSSALEQTVIAFGLAARALALRIRHAQARGDLTTTAGLGSAPLEQQVLAYEEAYRASGDKATEIEKARIVEPSGHGANSVKSIARMVHETPHTYWIAVLDTALRRIQAQLVLDEKGVRRLPAPTVKLREFHELVAMTYYHGWLISTGMRGVETAHVRLDIQYSEAHRAVREAHLRAIDRKETGNTLAHECKIRDRFIPRWLEELYLSESRPFFMRTYRQRGTRKFAGRPPAEHPWLFVQLRGDPYGCLEESPDGGDRDPLALHHRVSDLCGRWKRFYARLACELKLGVPTSSHEGGLHAVRNTMGYAVRQQFGLTAAANYLGDQEGSIIAHYEGVAGRHVDTTDLVSEYVDWQPPSSAKRRQAAEVGERQLPDDATSSVSARNTNLFDEAERKALDALTLGHISKAEYSERLERIRWARQLAA